MMLPLRYWVGSATTIHTASAMSAGVATLPSGFVSANLRQSASWLLRIDSHSGVRTGPGDMARIPSRARERAPRPLLEPVTSAASSGAIGRGERRGRGGTDLVFGGRAGGRRRN